jgi:uncharacterized protein (TIGR00266 family)
MSDINWYVAVGGQQQGPMSEQELIDKVRADQVDRSAHIFQQGMDSWQPITSRAQFANAFGAAASPPLPPPVPAVAASAAADVIDYEIFGEEMQFVEITLDPQEACVAEAGAFMYMDPGIAMETVFGDGSAQSKQGGLMGMLGGAVKRVVTGESLFMTIFGNQGTSRQKVAFASPYPGRIIAVDLKDHANTLLCQKDAFLCAAKGISVGIAFQKKLGAGLFGGEGFILQKLQGDGMAFVHAGGHVIHRDLKPGETVRVDTGCIVAFEERVDYDIQFVGGIKTALFGGEGIAFATLTGPGRIWLQSLPFSRLAGRIFAAAPQTGGRRKGEGSILDHVGGLGNLLDGS